jgi:uncharacterized protein (TIRG00374 family)
MKLKLYPLRAWLFGILLLAALILGASHYAEIEHFVLLMQHARPEWLLLALVLQGATYLSVATIWYYALRSGGSYLSIGTLIPIGLAKLFSDQAMPTGGMSGTAFLLATMNRHGISTHICMATLLVNLISYHAAYLLMALASVLLLWLYHAINAWITGVTILFSLIAIAIPITALWLRRMGNRQLPAILYNLPDLEKLIRAYGNAPVELLRNGPLLSSAILLQLAVFLLDATTLWVMLEALGRNASLLITLPSFILASIVATLSPIPMGLGTFEATCTGMLSVLGVPLETALTATLLLRGFTLWLPMLPGLWFVRRELH